MAFIHGTTGDDVLTGPSGSGFRGGKGDDLYIIDLWSVVTERLNFGTDTIRSAYGQTLPDNVENLELTATKKHYGKGNGLDNIITGSNAESILRGLEGNDSLNGMAGDDWLDGGVGSDLMRGGEGNDTFLVDGEDVVIELEDQGADRVITTISYTLGDNLEFLDVTGSNVEGVGNGLNNILTGKGVNLILRGGEGDDIISGMGGLLEGGGGDDQLRSWVVYRQRPHHAPGLLMGGQGNDLYSILDGDVLIENPDEGEDTVLAGMSFTLGENFENVMAANDISTLGKNLRLVGNDMDNRVTGNNGRNVLDGGKGRDVLSGGVGDDIYVVDDPYDQVIELENSGRDTVITSINFTLAENIESLTLSPSVVGDWVGTGSASANLIVGGNGANVLNGMKGSDILRGLDGNDALDGGEGSDRMRGGLGDDLYIIDDLADIVFEYRGQGMDTINTSVSVNLFAGVEDAILTGESAIDVTGNWLDNSLYGNSAANTLEGGKGADFLVGGKGDDTYQYGRGQGHDTIWDVDETQGNRDTLQFAAGIKSDQLWFSRMGDNLNIKVLGGFSAVTIKDWYLSGDHHIEAIRAGDGRQLSDTNIDALVSAMAMMTLPAGRGELTSDQLSVLSPVLAAVWN